VIRVTSATADPARILGTLRSNGRIVLLAPNGVTFGPAATVAVGGLVASTGRMDVASFMSGGSLLDLTAMTAAVVENRGAISAGRGGAVVLAAARVVNTGVIQAPSVAWIWSPPAA
jgi:large exoprotein involved in heme utilization and adhesion